MKLGDLLAAVPDLQVPSDPRLDGEVKGISTNSHACQAGDLFVGMPGTRVDGGEFWQGALNEGAIAAIISPEAAEKVPPDSNKLVFVIDDVAAACAYLSSAFYEYPARQMQTIGVTGTNGKTTTTHLIEFLLASAQQPTALLGTLYARWPGYQKTASYTTPFAVDLQAQLAEAAKAGSKYAVMEVSSHSLVQKRILGCAFAAAVFTNLTQDHLDFHKDMEDYFAAKALLFSPDYLQGRAIVNGDDAYGQRIIKSLDPERVWRYSTQSEADLWTSDLILEPMGVKGKLHTPAGETAFELPLVGQYNIENMLAAVGVALHCGIELEAIASALPRFTGVPGRMERVQLKSEQDISIIVDYAHTPDSLENVLKASRPFISKKMICVFGCGGDRDRTKRPKMGKIAAELSDLAVVTSDNPRTEDPQRILDDILAGIPEETTVKVIADRAEAIRTAILEAKPGDGVIIAGKGHEDYQILGTEKIHFDDREQARSALEERYNS